MMDRQATAAHSLVPNASAVIRIRRARTHNLQNVCVDLPVGSLIVMTGVSGSGKSSLAFDTLFAEGQRRYLDSITLSARSMVPQLPRPDVDEISGLPPTVSVDQRVSVVPARTTLAMTSEIHDYLRVLYARAGTSHCTQCGRPVRSQSVDQIVQRTMKFPDRSRLMILSPLVRGRRGAHRDVLERIGRNGFVRARVDGELLDIADCRPLDPAHEHSIDAVIDRIVLKPEITQRLRESIELACRESDGSCLIAVQTDQGWSERMFSTRFSCPDCDLNFPPPEPRLFSFSSAWGACTACQGFGVRGVIDDVEDVTVFRRAPCPECHGSRLQPFARGCRVLGMTIADFTAQSVDQTLQSVHSWQRLIREENKKTQETVEPEQRLVLERILPDIQQRLLCLQQVGIGYLTLDRPTRTLSGGEFQRARLAACLGSGLHGACFVLDEPTAGLHPGDTQRLLQTLYALRDNGATVVVVEHDGDVMRAADWLIDLGPHAGVDGGRLLFAGPPQQAALVPDSPTAQYLRGELMQSLHASPSLQHLHSQQHLFDAAADTNHGRDKGGGGDNLPMALQIRGARLNNLRDLTVDIPLRKLVVVSGVSGSGKSSLVMDTLLPVATAACRPLGNVATTLRDVQCAEIGGLTGIQRVVSVNNSPFSTHGRSCLATISGLWDYVRRLFAKTRDARARGYTAQRFSFNAGQGRCAECRGTGTRNLQMKFLPDAVVPCPVCRGRRFGQATLAVRFNGKSVADVLEMRLDQAIEFFHEFSRIRELLTVYCRVGLGYLTLVQRATTYSGGESQRVRLATELASASSPSTLFILDEPTSGLHPADVVQLIELLRQLVISAHSVVVIEHQSDVIRSADWIIDIGPDCGSHGGTIVYSGPGDGFLNAANSVTAEALRTSGSAIFPAN